MVTPTISVLPETVDFGEVVAADQVEAPPADRRASDFVFVTNTGRADLRATLTLNEPGFVLFDPASGDPVDTVELRLSPDEGLGMEVQLAPPSLGATEAVLSVASNDPERAVVDVLLTGTGRAPYAPDIAVEPRTLDFGEVALDATAQAIVTVTNLGDAPLSLGTAEQAGAGAFQLASGDPSGTVLLPTASLPVLVAFTAVQPGGDSGTWTVRSNDPDEPEITVELTANGGGDFDYPEAVITGCPATADVTSPVPIVLSGAASISPSSSPLTYAWSMVRRPAAGDPANVLMPDDEVETTFTVDASGVWEVALTVTDEAGRPSVPAKCVVDASPIDDVFVELSWAGPTADLDLHLALDGAPFFAVPNDVSYCNPAPDWGTQGDPSDDPRLARDDDDGLGPEIISLPIAADDTAYVVRVHHFDDGDDGAVTATVVVWANGTQVAETSEVLARNEVWEVGQVNWPDATFGLYGTLPTDAGGERECAP